MQKLKLLFKLLLQIISLQFKILKLDIDIWNQKRQWKNNDSYDTYTQVCLKCGNHNRYEFEEFVPEKHECLSCGEIF